MPKLSKGHNAGNIVYKEAFPIAIFTRGKFYYGGGGDGGDMLFSGGGGGELLLPENIIVIFWGELLVAETHSRFPGGGEF